jgi:hypothetical protein
MRLSTTRVALESWLEHAEEVLRERRERDADDGRDAGPPSEQPHAA